MKNKIITVILMVLFLGVMFSSLFHISMTSHVSGGMSECLFMMHEETELCPMSALDHLNVWSDSFQILVPVFTKVLLVLGIGLVFLSVPPNIIISRRLLYAHLKYLYLDVSYLLLFPKRFLQEFFARGILHPKLF